MPEIIGNPLLLGGGSSGSGSVITVIDELDEHGGTIRHINAVSLEGDTVRANVLGQGYTAHNSLGELIVGTANISESYPDGDNQTYGTSQ